MSVSAHDFFLDFAAAFLRPYAGRKNLMPIIFNGPPPYEPLYATLASSEPTQDGVLLTLVVNVDGPPAETVPVQVLLKPEVARELCSPMPTQAYIAERWRQNSQA
jgi:hypothetical protein